MKNLLIILLVLVFALSGEFVPVVKANKIAEIYSKSNSLLLGGRSSVKEVPKADFPPPEYLGAIVTPYNRQKIDLSWSKPFIGTIQIEDDFETGNTHMDLPTGWWQKASDMHPATSWRDVTIFFTGWVALAAANYPQWVYGGDFSCGANGAGEEPYTYLISDVSFVLPGGVGILDYAMFLTASNEQGVFLYDGTLSETDPSDNIYTLKTYNPTSDTSWFHDEIDLSAYSGTFRLGIFKAGVGGVSSFDNIRIGVDSYPAGDQPVSYDIYRNGSFAVNVAATGLTETYEDNNFDDGDNEYYLQAVYSTDISIPSESVTVFIDANPSPHLLEGTFDPNSFIVDLSWYSPGHFPLHWFGYVYETDISSYLENYFGYGELQRARTYFNPNYLGMDYPVYIDKVSAAFIESIQTWSSDQFRFIVGTGVAGSETVLHTSDWLTADPSGNPCEYTLPATLTMTEKWFVEVEFGSPSNGTPTLMTNVHLIGVDPDGSNSVYYWTDGVGTNGWYTTGSYTPPYDTEDFAFLCYGYNDEPVITKEDKNKGLVSYNVYRNESFLGNTSDKYYTDISPIMGDNTYYVTAVYTDPAGESTPSNEVTLGPKPQIVLPVMITETVVPGVTDSRAFTIGNSDQGTLEYDLSFEYTDVMSQEVYGTDEHFNSSLGTFTVSGTGWEYSTTIPVYETGYAMVNSLKNSTVDTYLTSAPFDISGLQNTTLSFAYLWNGNGLTTSYLTAEYSTDGTNFTVLTTYDVADQLTWATANFAIPDSTVKVRFHCVYPKGSGLYAGVDVIQIKGQEQLIAPWFSFVSPVSGTVDPFSNVQISSGYDASTLLEGEYHGELTVTSNDPEYPNVVVPVALTVAPGFIFPWIVNLTTSYDGSNFFLSWDANPIATGYCIYSSSNPYGTFDLIDSTAETSWSVPVSESKKFYFITATDEVKKKTPEKIFLQKDSR